jgi:hypothetical protein
MTQLSQVDEYTGFITRNTALYFQLGATGTTTLGTLPSTHKTSSFSFSMFISFRSSIAFPLHPGKLDFFQIINPVSPTTPPLVKLSVSQTAFTCTVGAAMPTMAVGMSPDKKWVMLTCGHDAVTRSAQFYS